MLNDVQRQAIARMIESGPIPAAYGVVRWRLIDLTQWIYEEFRVTIANQTLSRELRAMGYRKLSARPRHHAQVEGAIEDFKKNFHARLDEIARKKAVGVEAIEIWFQMLWRRAEPILFGSPNQSDGAAVMQPNDTNSPTILLAIELSAQRGLLPPACRDRRSRICIGLTAATPSPY
jgi:hypothetical protein